MKNRDIRRTAHGWRDIVVAGPGVGRQQRPGARLSWRCVLACARKSLELSRSVWLRIDPMALNI